MKMSFIAVAVLGSSAVCASAQESVATARGAGSVAVAETVCAQDCLAQLHLTARADGAHAPAGGVIFTHEIAAEPQQASGRFGAGTLTVGRQFNIDYTTLNDVGDPFHGGLAAQAAPHGARADDSVAYEGTFAGVSTGAKWGKGDVDGSPSGRAWGMSVGVSLGPLTLRAAHQNRNVAKVTRYDQVDITMAAKNSIVAANMRFDWGTAYAAYSASRGWGSSPLFNPDNPYSAGVAATRSTNSRDVLAGGRAHEPLDHAAGVLHPSQRPRSVQPRCAPGRRRRQLRRLAPYGFLRRVFAHPASGRRASGRQAG